MRREYDINSHTTEKKRRKAAANYIEKINRLLEKGYVVTKPKAKKSAPTKKAASPKEVRKTLTLLDAVQDHIDRYKTTLSPGTIDAFKTLKKTLNLWMEKNFLENLLVVDFDTELTNSFFDYLKNEHKVVQFDRTGVSNKTFNNVKGDLGRVINDLVAREIIKPKHNKISRIEKKKVESGMNIPFTTSQMATIR
ncbi:phage integrase SAM-like domain-containing protein, partial [Amycolatopsis magusensis]